MCHEIDVSNGHEDLIDLQGQLEAEREAEYDASVAEQNSDKWGHPGLPRKDARFLAMCRDEMTKEDYFEIESLEQGQGEAQAGV